MWKCGLGREQDAKYDRGRFDATFIPNKAENSQAFDYSAKFN